MFEHFFIRLKFHNLLNVLYVVLISFVTLDLCLQYLFLQSMSRPVSYAKSRRWTNYVFPSCFHGTRKQVRLHCLMFVGMSQILVGYNFKTLSSKEMELRVLVPTSRIPE